MKKLLSIVIALAMIMAMAVSVSAFEGSIEVSLYAGNNVNWQIAESDPVTVNAAGEYTLKLSDLSIDPSTVTVIYIKDAAVQADGENHPKSDITGDIQILTKSLKINGAEIALTEGYPTTLTDAGAFDICWYNIWATSFFSTDGMDTITDIEVVFEIADAGAAPAEDAAAPAEDASAPAEDTSAPAEDTAAPADTSSADAKPADTGIVLAVLPMAIAAAAVVASKRR